MWSYLTQKGPRERWVQVLATRRRKATVTLSFFSFVSLCFQSAFRFMYRTQANFTHIHLTVLVLSTVL